MDSILRILFQLTLPGCGVLAVAGLFCLLCGKGKYHRYLVWAAAAFLGASALYFGGIFLLGRFDLTWRNAPALILCAVLLISGWVGIALTLTCFLPMEIPGLPPILRRASKGLAVLSAAVVLLVTLWIGPMGIAFVYGDSEQVVEYRGQLLVERAEGFLSPDYSYYARCGPLFRGTERLWNSPTRIWGDFDLK